MNICFIKHIIYPFPLGATDTLEVVNRLSERGHNLFFVGISRDRENTQGIREMQCKEKSIIFPSCISKLAASYSLLEVLKIVTHLNKMYKLDVLHCYSGDISGYLLKNMVRIPFVYDIRAPDIDLQRGWRNKVKLPLHLKSLQESDSIFVISEPLKEYYVSILKLPEKKVHVIPTGVNPETFSPNIDGTCIREAYRILSHEILVMYVGNLDSSRRIDIVLRTFSRVNLGFSNAKLMVVGHGDALPILKKISTQLKISESVIFTGFIPYKKIPKYLAAADILVSHIPKNTYFDYSWPLKTLEYIAMGKPLIATDIIPHRKMLSGTGLPLTKMVEESYAKNMIYTIQNISKIQEKIKGIRPKVQKRYSWREITYKIEKIYYTITKKH